MSPDIIEGSESTKMANDITTVTTRANGSSDEIVSAELRSGRFSVLAAIGVQYSISATPLAVGGYLSFILGVGGSPYFFYCFLVSAFGQLLVAISLAEIAAVYPHASGQVFWTSKLAPEKWARGLSYWNGASTTLAWIFANSGTYVITAYIWLGAMEVRFSEYHMEPYQVFLVTCACGAFGILLNTLLFNYYPKITTFMVWFINLGTIFVFVSLLARAHPKASAHQVFVEVVNETGWSSNGLVFLLGFLPGGVAVACFDTAAHLAEEMEKPERQIPQVMVGASLLCALSALPMIIMFLFCTVNPEGLLAPIGGQPVYQILVDGLQSDGLLVVCLIIYCITYLSSCPATIATGSRLVWSFAKAGGLPFARWISHVQPSTQIPVNAVFLVATASSLIGLLVFGPSTVLNGVFGAAGVCFFFSYAMPIVFLLWRGRDFLPKQRYFNLGKAGIVLNIVAFSWQCLFLVFSCFPLYQPVTPTSMNWASVSAVVGLTIFAVNWFVYAKKHYQQPKTLFVEGLQGNKVNPV